MLYDIVNWPGFEAFRIMELFSEIVTLDELFNTTAFCSIVRKEIGHFHLLDLKS